MHYLLDTHTCFWAIFEKRKLSDRVKNILIDEEHTLLVSQISLWEIAIKVQVGKLTDFQVSFNEFIKSVIATGFEILPLKNEHVNTYFSASYFVETHKDPFDRLLLATADFESTGFITKDEKFAAYTNIVEIIW